MNFLFTGGGTGGHIYPALAVAQQIRRIEPRSTCLFLGREGGAENRVMEGAVQKIFTLPMSPLSKTSPSEICRSVKTTLTALKKTTVLLRQVRPDVIFGTGGYVSFPALYSGQKLKIPTVVHESNVIAGQVSRLLYRKCAFVLLGSESCRSCFPKAKQLSVCGTPVRPAFFRIQREQARRALGIAQNDFFLLSFGGSGGARQLNDLCLNLMQFYTQSTPGVRHFHATGERYYKDFSSRFIPDGRKCRIFPYIDNMPLYMNAADAVIARAGALTIAEICAVAVPAVLIPSPNVAADHQTQNARALADAGAALSLSESAIAHNPDLLIKAVAALRDDRTKRESMRSALHACAHPDAARDIAHLLVRIAKETHD